MSSSNHGSEISQVLQSIITSVGSSEPFRLNANLAASEMDSPKSSITFLDLPLEIRYMIFEQLYRSEPVCYIFPNSPITSISHRGPPRSLVLTCRQLRDEVRAHYYSYVTFRFSVFGVLPVKSKSTDFHRVIRRARKIEFMLVWNVAKHGLTREPIWNDGWLEEHLEMVKNEGRLLTTVIISLRDASKGAGWDKKGPLLKPLEKLKGRVRFAVGEIIVGEDVEDDIRSNLEEYIQGLNRAWSE